MVLTEEQIEATVSSFLRKRQNMSLQEEENLDWDTNLLQLADFAHTLLYKQHALYPHLRPMYRTVHRRVPRRLVFRAIRWVNPARMFKSAMLTRQQIADMSPEERAKAIAEVADYRREAHLIRNRYNEMISLIHEGKLPYYIRHAGVKIQTMEQYLERAERLKLGTTDWEFELDKKAVEFREEMGKHGEKFDDVKELWKDGLPPFFDPKRGRAKKAPMRLIDKEGNRLKIEIFARDFIDVHPDEIREGEDLWIPKKIEIAAEADEDPDGAIPIRVPTHFVDNHFSNARNFLENEGQFQTELGDGRKVVIRHNKLDDPHARREFRATQQDPLWGDRRKVHDPRADERRIRGEERTAERVKGRWGEQPHGGGVRGEPGSQDVAEGLGGDEPAHPTVPFTPVPKPPPAPFQPPLSGMGGAAHQAAQQQVAEREARIRAAQQRAQQAGPPDPNEGKPIDQTITALNGDKFNPVVNNKAAMEKSAALLDKLGIGRDEQFMYGEQDLSNIDPSDVEFLGFVGSYAGGILARDNAAKAGKKISGGFGHGVHLKIKGKDYLYKIIPGEQYAERASFALDKALGLGVMPYIEVTNLGVEWLKDKDYQYPDPFDSKKKLNATVTKADVAEWVEMGERGGGFLQEWHVGHLPANRINNWNAHGPRNIESLHSNFGLITMDLMLGQSDRHNSNFGLHKDNGKVVAYDNGANGRFAEIEAENQRGKGLVKWELWRDSDPGHPNWRSTSNYPRLEPGVPTGMDRDVFIGEFDDWFDQHFDMDTVLDVAEACNMHVVGELMNGEKVTTEVIKKRLREYALYTHAFDNDVPSWAYPGHNAKVNDKAPSPERSVSAGFREVTSPAAPGTTDPQIPMGVTQAGMSPRVGGVPVQSSMDSRPEFRIIKQRYE